MFLGGLINGANHETPWEDFKGFWDVQTFLAFGYIILFSGTQ